MSVPRRCGVRRELHEASIGRCAFGQRAVAAVELRAEHGAEMAQVIERELDVGLARPEEPLEWRLAERGARTHPLFEQAEAFLGERAQDALMVAEVMVRRLVTHLGAPGNLPKAHSAHALFGDERGCAIEDFSLEISHLGSDSEFA